jgi:O-antigen ligase
MAEEKPLTGVGLGNFEVVQTSFLASQLNLFSARKLHTLPLATHNTYLQVLSELGLPGLVLYGGVILAVILPALDRIRAMRARSLAVTGMSSGLVMALIVLLTAYFFVSGTYAKHIWLLLGIVAAIPTVLRADASPASD